MKCNSCKCDIPQNSAFCPYCGQKTTPPVTFCNQCGTKLAGDFKFCSACGAPVGGTASDTTANQKTNDASRENVRFTSTMGTGSTPSYNNAPAVHCHVDMDYHYGKGAGLFSQTTGRFEIIGNTVTFTPKIGKKHVHTFNVSDVIDTDFSGPSFGELFSEYTVFLRSGEKYSYFFSPLVKKKLEEVDRTIRSVIGK